MTTPNISSVLMGQAAQMAQRDAIHIAIAPVVAYEYLLPGSPINFAEAGNCELVKLDQENPIGVVSPWIKDGVKRGDRFYMLLNPNSITSLRHDWSHPAFFANQDQNESVLYINKFADMFGYDYETFLRLAESYERYGDYHYDNSESYKDVDYGVYGWEDFWQHYSKVTGREVGEKYGFFTCSC